MKNDVHHAAHEEQLFALSAGTPDLRAAFDGSALSTCPGCRELVEELSATEATLAQAGADQRALERSACGAAPAPGEERAWAEISGRLARTVPAALERPRPPARLGLSAAAALVVAVGVLAVWLARRPDRSPVVLGPGPVAVEALHPVGNVTRFAPFTWRAELPPRGWFVVRVEGRRDDGTLFEEKSANLVDARWDPADADSHGWPRELRWEVLVFDASGSRLGSASASTSRSRP